MDEALPIVERAQVLYSTAHTMVENILADPRSTGMMKGSKDRVASTIADIFDALTTRRSYKNAVTSFQALRLMRHEMGATCAIVQVRRTHGQSKG